VKGHHARRYAAAFLGARILPLVSAPVARLGCEGPDWPDGDEEYE